MRAWEEEAQIAHRPSLTGYPPEGCMRLNADSNVSAHWDTSQSHRMVAPGISPAPGYPVNTS